MHPIVLEITPERIAADGVSRATITASIDPDAADAFKTLTFKTSAGRFFPATTTNGQEVRLVVNDAGKATALLQSDPAFTGATVEVSTNGLSVSDEIPFDPVMATDMISLSSSASTVAADGFSEVVVTAAARKTLQTGEQRIVTFQTSAGTLTVVGAVDGAATGTVVRAIADGSGVASVRLQSTKQLTTARVTATLLGFSLTTDVTFVAVSPGAIVQIAADPTTVPADDATVTRITATVANNLPSGRRSVQFSSSLTGTFIGNQPVEADASNRAVILFKSRAAGTAIIAATVDGNRAETTVSFRPALPDQIVVSPAAPRVRAADDANVRIAVRLLRAVGTVSEDTLVDFVALDATGQRTGVFSNVELSRAGVASANYFPGTTSYRGVVTIRATVAGSPVVGSAEILIVDP